MVIIVAVKSKSVEHKDSGTTLKRVELGKTELGKAELLLNRIHLKKPADTTCASRGHSS